MIRNLSIVLMGFIILITNAAATNTRTIERRLSIEEAVLYHVNQYRSQHGLNKLTLNSAMSREAAQHSRNMASHAVGFGHTNFNKRIHRLFDKLQNCQGGAENVAYNYRDGQDVVRNWLTSPGHKRNIVGNYNLTGIGVARDSRGKLYFTQLFIRKGPTEPRKWRRF